MFIRRKGFHYRGIWIGEIFWSMPQIRDPEGLAVYEVPDEDGRIAVNGGLWEEIKPEQVTTYFEMWHPDLQRFRHGRPEPTGWKWIEKQATNPPM